MFGTIRPCRKLLGRENMEVYQKYYCGLCMGMERCAGRLSRFIVNYDMCLAYVLADSIEIETIEKRGRCPFAPWRKLSFIDNNTLMYIAAVNFLLTYHKLLDNVYDDHSRIAIFLVKRMQKRYEIVCEQIINSKFILESNMEELHNAEKSNSIIDIKAAAEPFARMLEQLMAGCLNEPLDAKVYAKISYWLGIWVYVIDACLDIKSDYKKGKYNPITAGRVGNPEAIIQQRKNEITDLLICCRDTIFQLLQLLSCCKNKELIYSVLENDLPKEVADLLR